MPASRFRQAVFFQHLDGINRRRFSETHGLQCPRILGIDEHFFTRRQGFATTLCDLRNHRVYDVVLGRSQAALDAYCQRLQGKERVRVVCMDLSSSYRALARKHFPQARIVADRFHVIRLINERFLACWRGNWTRCEARTAACYR